MPTDIFDEIPENISGKQVSLRHARADATEQDAVKAFQRACKRLLNFAVWKDLCGIASASFALFGPDGSMAQRLAHRGDFIRIDIPGPGPAAGKGYDWVKIEKLISFSGQPGGTCDFLLQVRPCPPPPSDGAGTAHFLAPEATSTFVVQKKGTVTTAYYFGRNEHPNNGAPGIVDKVRNTAVALGSFAGIAELQWGALLKGLLADEIGGS